MLSLLPPRAVRRLPAGPGAKLQLLMDRGLKRKPRRFAAAATTLGFTVDGCTSDLIQRYLYLFGMWEPDITHWLREHLRPGDVVIDIGANIGYFSLLAASAVGPTGTVISFEPVPSIADMLEANARRNGLAIVVRREVVSDKTGTAEIFRSAETNLGRSSTLARSGSTSEGTVPMVLASDALPEELWSRIRFIKVDVEGDEQRVLRGLVPVLAALPDAAAVFVEVTPADLEARGGTAEELMTFMSDLGFESLAVRNSYAARDYAYYARQSPVPLLRTPTKQADVIFVKRQQ
jgi:FkbM family methyltransferase